MGLNKRYVNEEIIRTVLRDDGFENLIQFIRNPDVLIIEDDFSTKVCQIIKETENIYILEKLLEIL